jgi:predicted ATP-grasp superfamily ATP-dependent carboligase
VTPRVLVSADDFYAVLAGVRGLRAGGYEPWLAVPGRGTYAARSRAVAGVVTTASPQDAPGEFARDLAAAAARIGADVVLPGTEDALEALSGRNDLFGSRVLGVPPAEIVARATSKTDLERRAAEAGLSVPSARVLRREDVASAELDFPVILKPLRSNVERADGSLAIGWVHRVDTAGELAAGLARVPGDELIVQQFVEGPLTAIAGVAWEGNVVCTSHQVARRIHPPLVGVSSFAETIEQDAQLDAAVARLVGGIGWSGIFQLQLIDGHAIDFNPRMYGSMALAIAAGLNLPAIWVDLLLGREPRVGTYRPGTRYRVEDKDLRAVVAELRQGRMLAAAQAALPRRRTTHAVFALHDPAPLLTTFAKAWASIRGKAGSGGTRA